MAAMPGGGSVGDTIGGDSGAAALLVLHPSGQRTRVSIDSTPFLIGRHADNHLVLRDNRASRNHARILAEGGLYFVEDLNSRHGTWVNGERVARRALHNSDRIDFGVRESYQLTFTMGHGEVQRILEQISSTSKSGPANANNLAKLSSLVEVARALQNSLSTIEVLTAVVDAALAVTGCERGFLMLRKDPELEISVARDRSGKALEPGDLRVPRSVIRRALNSRRDLLSMSFDPMAEQGLRPEMTIAALELRSVVCLPLIHIRSGMSEETRVTSAMEATVGLLYMDSREAPADLSAGNRELLQTLAIEASTILENARLLEEERIKVRIEDELKIARDIQQGLLPPSLPVTGWFRAAGSSVASTQVGGDYYDVRQVTPDLWAAVVADVSGKGVSSALLASLLQGTFLMCSGDPADIESILSRLNAFLLERTRGEKYATLFYCTMDSSGLMSYSNAGHPAPYLVGLDGRLRKLHTSGMPVGMLEDAPFQTERVQLAPGDKIVIYSDGLTEAESADGTFFDTERLRVCLRDNSSRDAAGLHAALLTAVDRFTDGGAVRDDITSLVIEYSPG
jgi:sigma-B regulation protein RsbU (phosphoserine phosphatase)